MFCACSTQRSPCPSRPSAVWRTRYVAGTAASYAFTSTDSSSVLSSAAPRLVLGGRLPGGALSPSLRPGRVVRTCLTSCEVEAGGAHLSSLGARLQQGHR